MLVVRDYQPDRRRKVETILADARQSLPAEGLLDLQLLARSRSGTASADDGLRGAGGAPRLPPAVAHPAAARPHDRSRWWRFGSLQRLMKATLEELDDVEGIGEARARSIREGLHALRRIVHPRALRIALTVLSARP